MRCTICCNSSLEGLSLGYEFPPGEYPGSSKFPGEPHTISSRLLWLHMFLYAFALYPFTVMNLSHNSNYMLNPVSPSSELSKLEAILVIPDTLLNIFIY